MDVKVRDVIIGLGACTDSKVNRIRFKDNDFAAIADFDMTQAAVQAAKEKGKQVSRRESFLCRPILYARFRNV